VAELLLIEGMKKGYTRGGWAPVFVDVSLEVMWGEIVAVIGGRLEGKTTLLKIAAGVERPDSGTVSLEGRALADLADRPREVRWVDRDGPGFEEAEVAEGAPEPFDARPVYFDAEGQFVSTRLYRREAFRRGHVLEGPAVIEQMDSTTVLHPEQRLEVDAFLNLHILRGGRR